MHNTRNPLDRVLQNIVEPGLSVGSGTYSHVVPALKPKLSIFGEFEYENIEDISSDSASDLLQVAAFGGVAPGIDDVSSNLYSQVENIRHDSTAGFTLGNYAGWSQEGERQNASSGGLTTWLLTTLLELGLVDGVIHMKPTAGGQFAYQISRTAEEIREGSKTRYAPAHLADCISEVLRTPGQYAVVAIPTLIYEVRLLQRVEASLRERIVFTVGLICGHQKSSNYGEYLGWQGGFAPGSLEGIDFRKKVPGLPANLYQTEFIGHSSRLILSQHQLKGTDWGQGYFKNAFSDYTDDAFNETADVVFGDAWLDPYLQDYRGTNIVIVRDPTLHGILLRSAKSGRIFLEELEVSEVVRSQAALVRHSIFELPYRLRLLDPEGRHASLLRRNSSMRLSVGRKQIQRTRIEIARRSRATYVQARGAGDLGMFDAAMDSIVRKYRAGQTRVRRENVIHGGPRSWVHSISSRLGSAR